MAKCIVEFMVLNYGYRPIKLVIDFIRD